jgi:cysteine desulfurase
MQPSIYCDNAATTKTRQEVIEAMLTVFTEDYGNPSSLHKYGRKAKALLQNARKQVARLINCEPSQVFFTSGGTESNNLAIEGLAQNTQKSGGSKNHIISCLTEHSAVIEPIKQLENEGWKVTWLPVDKQGFIDLAQLEASISPKTLLVSIMHANNEVGTVQDISRIGEICKQKEVFFHTDAVQSAGKVPIDVKESNIDFLSISGHKIYGPKGVGVLFAKNPAALCPLIFGGTQEAGLKPGTENLPGIVGIGKAIELRMAEIESERERLIKMQSELAAGLLGISGLVLNGPTDWSKRVPGNLNVSFEDIEGDALVLHLDLKGISVSSGSACAEGSIEPSRVLAALYPQERHYAFNSLRISFGLHNTLQEVPLIVEAIKNVVAKMRTKTPKAA